MNHSDNLLIRKITNEYLNFIKESKKLIEETRRATVLALKKALKLKEGEQILIKDDGSLEIINEDGKENNMAENENQNSDRLTLNGRKITVEELERQREAIKNQRGAKLEEVSEGDFRLRLND